MRTVKPKRLWRDVQETANPKERLERVKQAMARVRPELTASQQEARDLEAARAEFAHHPGKEAGAWHDARRLRLLGWLLLLLDVPVQYLLNSSVVQVEAWKVAVGSVALPLGIAGVVQYLGEPILYDKDRPARSIRITKLLAACSFLVTGAGASVFLFARQAGEATAAYLVTLTAGSLWAVAEALPITAGFVGAWAHMLERPAFEERRLNDVREHVATLERLLERLQNEEAAISGPLDVHRDTLRTVDRGVRMTPLLVVAFLLLSRGVAMLPAQRTPNQLCALFVDRTRSVDSTQRPEAIGLVLHSLPEHLRTLGCKELIAGTFTDEGAWAPRRWLQLPPAASDRDCAAVPAAPPPGTAGLLANLRGFHEHFQREAVAQCERAEAAVREERVSRERTFLAAAREIIEQPPVARATTTDLVGLIENLLASRVTLSLIVTDGVDTAHDSGASLRIAWGSRVVLLLVPSRPEAGGREGTRQAAARWRAVGVASVPFTILVAPAGWEQVAGTHAAP